MKHLIITADDYGVFPGVNAAIIESVKEKKVNSVSVLANFEGNDKYPGSVKNLEKLLSETGDAADLGCHLTVTSGKPITGDRMDFACDKDGNFLSYTEFRNFKSPAEKNALKEELCEQVNKLHTITGFKIKHLTNHHNSLTLFPHHFDVYMEVARLFSVPMRSAFIRPESRQNFYLRFLNYKLKDDINRTERDEIMDFESKITEYFKQHSEGIKSPVSLDSRHYGPISLLPAVHLAAWQLVFDKRKKLDKLFQSFTEGGEESLEVVVHLGKANGLFADKSGDLEYPGVDRGYFDSRILEFKSIMGYKLEQWSGMQQKSWTALS